MKRKIIKIDEEKCNGCALCIPNCPEGAIQMIDGKARLISDLFCDGLGACLGHCPQGAIEVEEREAEPYDEKKVMANVVKQGRNVIKAHLEHLKGHNEAEYLRQAVEFLQEKGIANPMKSEKEKLHAHGKGMGGCPGSRVLDFSDERKGDAAEDGKRSSQLTQWPVQLHLVSPTAPYFRGKDVLLAADCVAYALADFHKDYLKGKSLAIACPKLDSEKEIYVQKITAMIDEAGINTLSVMIMEVPCCGGLLQLAQKAAASAKRKVPVKLYVVSLRGEMLKEEWVGA
jgi:ferredoxin